MNCKSHKNVVIGLRRKQDSFQKTMNYPKIMRTETSIQIKDQCLCNLKIYLKLFKHTNLMNEVERFYFTPISNY